MRKSYDLHDICKHMIRRFKKNEIDRLEEDLATYNIKNDFLQKFFEEEIYEIFIWILICSKNNKSFQFLYNRCPGDIFKKRLRKDDYSILKNFLMGRSAEEDLGRLTSENKMLDAERLKLLIKIDSEGMEDFMMKWKNSRVFGKGILEDYERCSKIINEN